MLRRMPRIQLYLPDELYAQVKAQGLPASELLQEAVREELRYRQLLGETELYLDELEAKVGAPSAEQTRRAREFARRIAARTSVQVG